jgi:two-component system LytT family response regulator
MPTIVNELFSAPVRVAIADDEPLARANLRLSLDARSDVAIVGEAASGETAIALVNETAPDVLFLDVRMPDGDAFAVMRALPNDPPLVVFLTAHEEYALDAFDAPAFDYLVKPCDARRFTECTDRVVATIAERRAAQVVKRLEQLVHAEREREPPPPRDERFLEVKHDGRIYFVPVSKIRWIGVNRSTLRFHTTDVTYTARGTLTDVLTAMRSTRLRRIHRWAAVNMDHVQEIDLRQAGMPMIVLSSGERLRASRRLAPQLLEARGDPGR